MLVLVVAVWLKRSSEEVFSAGRASPVRLWEGWRGVCGRGERVCVDVCAVG